MEETQIHGEMTLLKEIFERKPLKQICYGKIGLPARVTISFLIKAVSLKGRLKWMIPLKEVASLF